MEFGRKFSCSHTAISCVSTGKELKHGSELNMNSETSSRPFLDSHESVRAESAQRWRLGQGEKHDKRLARGEKKGTALLAVADAFEFPVAPATENSNWSINNSCCQPHLMSNSLLDTFGCQSMAWISDHATGWIRSRKKIPSIFP